MSVFHRPALESKQTTRSPLDEQDDEHQHQHLAQHCTGIWFEELVDDPEAERPCKCAPQIADTTEDDDHETVDDVALAEIGRHVVYLTESNTGEARDPGADDEDADDHAEGESEDEDASALVRSVDNGGALQFDPVRSSCGQTG